MSPDDIDYANIVQLLRHLCQHGVTTIDENIMTAEQLSSSSIIEVVRNIVRNGVIARSGGMSDEQIAEANLVDLVRDIAIHGLSGAGGSGGDISLETPTNIVVTPTDLSFHATWNAVTNALGYEVRLDSGLWVFTASNSYDGTGEEGTGHLFDVRAVVFGTAATSSGFDLDSPITVVDAIQDYHTGSTGADLTAPMLVASQRGILGTGWGFSFSPDAGQWTVELGDVPRLHAYQVGATVLPAGVTGKKMVLRSPSGFLGINTDLPIGTTRLTMAGPIKLGPPVNDFGLYDLMRITGGITGNCAVFQLNTNVGGVPGALNYKLNIEQATPSTVHSAYELVSQGSWIWGSLHRDYVNKVCIAAAYDPYTGAHLFTITATYLDSANPAERAADIRLGNLEVGNSQVEFGEMLFCYGASAPTIIPP